MKNREKLLSNGRPAAAEQVAQVREARARIRSGETLRRLNYLRDLLLVSAAAALVIAGIVAIGSQ